MVVLVVGSVLMAWLCTQQKRDSQKPGRSILVAPVRT